MKVFKFFMSLSWAMTITVESVQHTNSKFGDHQ